MTNIFDTLGPWTRYSDPRLQARLQQGFSHLLNGHFRWIDRYRSSRRGVWHWAYAPFAEQSIQILRDVLNVTVKINFATEGVATLSTAFPFPEPDPLLPAMLEERGIRLPAESMITPEIMWLGPDGVHDWHGDVDGTRVSVPIWEAITWGRIDSSHDWTHDGLQRSWIVGRHDVIDAASIVRVRATLRKARNTAATVARISAEWDRKQAKLAAERAGAEEAARTLAAEAETDAVNAMVEEDLDIFNEIAAG